MMESLVASGSSSAVLEFLAMQDDYVLRGFGLNPAADEPELSRRDRNKIRKIARSTPSRAHLSTDIERILKMMVASGQPLDHAATYATAGAGELEEAMNLGLLTLSPDGFALGDGIDFRPETYVRALQNLLTTPSVHPLFDATISERIQSEIAAGRIRPIDLVVTHAGRVATGTGLIRHLPVFPDASLAMILEAREELKEPLSAYRLAVDDLAQKFTTSPFDAAQFDAEIDDLYRVVADRVEKLRAALSKTNLAWSTTSDAHKDISTVSTTAIAGIAVGYSMGPLQGLISSGLTAAYSVVENLRSSIAEARTDGLYYLLELEKLR